MKYFIIVLLNLFSFNIAFAARTLVIFNEQTGAVNYVFLSGGFSSPDYVGRTDCLLDADLTVLQGVPIHFWKVENMAVREMTQGEKDAYNAAVALSTTTASRDEGKEAYKREIQLRALVSILLDELNALRQWTVAFKGEVAQASSLADLKARVATLPTLNDRTMGQAKTAYENKIDSGNVDQ